MYPSPVSLLLLLVSFLSEVIGEETRLLQMNANLLLHHHLLISFHRRHSNQALISITSCLDELLDGLTCPRRGGGGDREPVSG